MNARDKIARFLAESGRTQAYWQERAGISSNRPMSEIMHGKLTHSFHLVRLGQAMDLDLNWLFDDSQGYCPRAPAATGRFLTDAQEKLLDRAAEVCENDDDPALLRTAIDRVLARPAKVDRPVERALPIIEATVRPAPAKNAENGHRPRKRPSSSA